MVPALYVPRVGHSGEQCCKSHPQQDLGLFYWRKQRDNYIAWRWVSRNPSTLEKLNRTRSVCPVLETNDLELECEMRQVQNIPVRCST